MYVNHHSEEPETLLSSVFQYIAILRTVLKNFLVFYLK